MNEMVNRVASAIAKRLSFAPDINAVVSKRLAKAAIEAMREPTDSMVESGQQAMPAAEGYDLPDDCPDVWRAMIDEALK